MWSLAMTKYNLVFCSLIQVTVETEKWSLTSDVYISWNSMLIGPSVIELLSAHFLCKETHQKLTTTTKKTTLKIYVIFDFLK